MDQKAKFDLNFFIDASETIFEDLKNESHYNIHSSKTKPCDFKILKKLAKGGFGEVYVVERNKKIYAMKKVSKEIILKNPNTTFFLNEKEIMTSHNAEWLVKSHMCVQDKTYIYYIMDFIHGGDLLGYLSKIDIMNEDDIRLYAAEIFSSINEMHRMGWLHRDLKPDNILLDKNGHVKLADFGSCVRMVNNQVSSSTTVGTPDYVSPDVLSSIGETVTYGPEVDFWTVGVILYEMFYGTTPFYAESLKKTYEKIRTIEYVFPDDEVEMSKELKDLIKNLLTTKEKRLSFEQVKEHPFFKNINFDNLRNLEPPFKPEIKDEEDISNFVDTDFTPVHLDENIGFKNFIGFTYDPEYCKKLEDSIIQSITGSDENGVTMVPNKIHSPGLVQGMKAPSKTDEELNNTMNDLRLKIQDLED